MSASASAARAPGFSERGWLAHCANAYLLAFALDAALSLIDDLGLFAAPGLGGARSGVAHTVELGSLAIWIGAVLTPSLPRRVLLPPAAFILWWTLGAAPLGFLVESMQARIHFAVAAQCLLAVAAFLQVRARTGSWFLTRRALPRPLVRWRYTLGAIALHLLLGPFLLVGYGALYLGEQALVSSDRFVSFSPAGILLAERHYRRADREVVLAGMVHVGRGNLYADLFSSFVQPSTVVLREGVTDLKGVFQSKLSYQPLADAFGLATQPDVTEVFDELQDEHSEEAAEWPHVWNADIDASELSPTALDLLDRIAQTNAPGSARGPELQEYFSSLGRAGWSIFTHELIALRNQRVIENLDDALEDYERVVIPWGVMHMPGLQRAVVERGFERVSEERRLVASYSDLLRGALQMLRRESAAAAAPDSPPS